MVGRLWFWRAVNYDERLCESRENEIGNPEVNSLYGDCLLNKSSFFKWLARLIEDRTLTKDDKPLKCLPTIGYFYFVQEVEKTVARTVASWSKMLLVSLESNKKQCVSSLDSSWGCQSFVRRSFTRLLVVEKGKRLRLCQYWLENSDIFQNFIIGSSFLPEWSHWSLRPLSICGIYPPLIFFYFWNQRKTKILAFKTLEA